MNINFLIPTKNEHPELLKQCIDSINYFGENSKYSYEISVYSQKEIVGENVKWYYEHNCRGPLYGFNWLAHHTTGDYIICLVEDHRFINSFDNAIDFLKEEYALSKYKICSLSTNDGFPVGLPRYGQRLGSVLKLQEDLPNCQICRFPVIARETLNKYLNNCVFHPEFRYHAGDMWLGYWLFMQGEPSRECYHSRLQQTQFTKNAEYEVIDCNTFYTLVKNYQAGDFRYTNPEDINQSHKRYQF